MRQKFNILAVFLLFFGVVSAQKNETKILYSSENEMIITFQLNEYSFKSVNTPRGEALIPTAENGSLMLQKGAPDVLKFTEALIVPDLGSAKIQILDSKFETVENVRVAPSKGNFTRDKKPSDIPYEYGKSYESDSYFPGKLADLNTPYIARDFRGQALNIYPFQYNPKKNALLVYSELTVKITFDRQKGENEFVRTKKSEKIEREFSEIYARHFLNYEQNAKYTPLQENGNMLIICNDAWMTAVQPLADWKNTIGRPTVLVSKTAAGSTAAAIKTYVQNYYNTNGLTYLLLVGDAAQVPTNSGGGLGGDSDNAYAYVTGNDKYQEFFVGRFSAETEAHVSTQVLRTIEYEHGDQLADGFLNRTLGVASAEGPGDDNEYDYQHSRNMLADLLGYTYDTPSYEVYDGSQGGNDAAGNATDAQVAAALNSGAGVVTYIGHGSDTFWVSSGFDVADVNALTNDNKLPFIFDVACVNGNFVGQTCFGESWLRSENGGEPTGAIAICASTINQSWSPPMAAQDEMVDILVESYAENIKRTFTGIVVNGMFLMNDETSDFAMTDTWTTFGDPSLMVRTDNTSDMVISHNSELIFGSNEFTITCDMDGAFACLSKDGVIIGTATVAGGSASLPVSGVSPGDVLTVAVTGYNKVTYLQDITVISPEGAYLTLDGFLVNGETSIGFGQNGYIDLTLVNVGPDQATNVSVTMITTDAYIESLNLNSNVAFGTIAGNDGTATSSDKFMIFVTDNVPFGHVAQFNLTMTDGTNTWNAVLNLPIQAPKLEVGGLTINDGGNSILDTGETADVTVTLTNTGDADVLNILAYLSSLSSDLTINQSEGTSGGLIVGETLEFTFSVTALAQTMPGTAATLTFDATAGASNQYSVTKSFEIVIGFVPEYCASTANSDSDSEIYQVSFGSVVNNTAGECASYTDFSADESLTAVFVAGSQQSIAVKLGTCGGNYAKAFKIFVDWNYDGDFTDSDETVYTSISNLATFTATASFTVPSTAFEGPKFMRIVCVETSTPASISSCGTYSFGETEDYKIYLIPAATSENEQLRQNSVTVFPNPTDGQINIETKSAGAQIEIYNLNGQLIHSALSVSTLTQIDLTSRAKGIYFVKISDKNAVYNGKISVK